MGTFVAPSRFADRAGVRFWINIAMAALDILVAGTLDPAITSGYFVQANLRQHDLDTIRGMMLYRFVEYWCYQNCSEEWRLELTPEQKLNVVFKGDRDAVLFSISSDTDYFAQV